MAGPKSFVEKFDASRFGRNIGGVGGGLMALGQVLGAAAVGSANVRPGENATQGFARGLAVGVTGLGDSFEKERTKRQDRDFQVFARDQLQRTDLGDRERQMWESVLSGNRSYQALLPSLWSAQNSDEQIQAFRERSAASIEAARLRALGKNAPTADAIAKDEQTLWARQSLARLHADPDKDNVAKIIESMGVEGMAGMVESARRKLRTQDDATFPLWYEFASKANPLTPPKGLAYPTMLASGMYDFTMDGVQGAAPGAPASDPDATTVGDVSDEEAGVLDRALGAVKGIFGYGGDDGAKTADTPDAVLRGLLDATDPAANAGSSGVEPQPGSALYEPGVLNEQDVSDDILINSASPRQGGNGGLIRPGAETNKGRPSPLVDWRDEEEAFSGIINPGNVPGRPGYVSPFERRYNQVTRPIRGLFSTPDPNGARMRRDIQNLPQATSEWLESESSVPRDPYYDAGRKARGDLWRGLGR